MKIIKYVTIVILVMFASFMIAEEHSGNGNICTDDSGNAVNGFDVVAYFTQNKAVEGNENFATNYEGATFRFSSRKNLEAFKKNPEKFQPQYGGWCAYAIGAKKMKVKSNPESFQIKDGKLYLFYKGKMGDAKQMWNKNESGLLKSADSNWEKLNEMQEH